MTKLRLPVQSRDLENCTLEIRRDTPDGVRRLSFAASSETPVERFYGNEVLSHDKTAVRMDRISRGAVPLLFNHDWNYPVGMVDAGRLNNRRLQVDTHIFATTRAQEVGAMVDGGLRNVSLTYRVHAVSEDKKNNTFTATDWEPLEVSIVTVPADASVGIGRAADRDLFDVEVIETNPAPIAEPKGTTNVSDNENATAGASAESGNGKLPVEVRRGLDAVEVVKQNNDAIRNLCKAENLDESIARDWIENGTPWNTIAETILKIKQERSKATQSMTYLDVSKAEARRYSVMRALRAAVNKDWKDAGLELECNREISTRMNRLPRTETAFFVPLDVLMRDMPRTQSRDMTALGVSGSNFLVSTDNQPGSFIELLRNTSVALRMGVQRLSGLRGNVTIPKMTAGNTAYWLADEGTAITESQPTIAQLALAPKNVAALTELSHQLMQQSSPDAENLVMQSIAADIGLAVDVGVLRGSGAAGQPTGIVTTAGIGAFTGTTLAAAGFLNAVSDVAVANALKPGTGFVTHPATAALLMDRPNVTGATNGEPLWQGRMEDGTIRGYPAMASNQMTAATALFGWWPSVILAEWGVLELMVNPFSDFTRGLTAVRGWYTCDVGVRYAGAFSYATTIT